MKRGDFHGREALEKEAGAEPASGNLVLEIVGSLLNAEGLKSVRQIGRFHMPLRHFRFQQALGPAVPILHRAPHLMLTASQMMRIRLLFVGQEHQIQCDRNALEGDSQHFLESSAAVTLGILDITEMSEEQAESVFEAIRFAANGGEPFCVWCDCQAVYRITRKVKNRKTGEVTERRIFKCQKCLKQFSVTSGTQFHGRKLSFKKIMLGAFFFANGAAGKAALHLRRDIRSNYKSSWLLLQKLREAMTSYIGVETRGRLTGEIEMDSTSVGGSVRKANRAVDRKNQPRRDMSKVTNLSVLVDRESRRVVPFLGNEAQLVKVINTLVENPKRLIVDDHNGWNPLHALFPVSRIRHKDQYSDLNGTSTNLAESHWSRFKRMYHGTYRHTAAHYSHLYNRECSWREEHCQISNGDQFILTLASALHHPSSRRFRGYYQRTLRKAA